LGGQAGRGWERVGTAGSWHLPDVMTAQARMDSPLTCRARHPSLAPCPRYLERLHALNGLTVLPYVRPGLVAPSRRAWFTYTGCSAAFNQSRRTNHKAHHQATKRRRVDVEASVPTTAALWGGCLARVAPWRTHSGGTGWMWRQAWPRVRFGGAGALYVQRPGEHIQGAQGVCGGKGARCSRLTWSSGAGAPCG
jgi:hypothetical protein